MLEALRTKLQAREGAMLALIEELVLINSHTANPAGVAQVGSILRRELESIPGVEVRELPSSRFGPHLFARTEAARESAEGAVAIVGHHDTVFPPGSFEGFRLAEGIARGPGVLDMKGGLVVAIEALRALAELGQLSKIPVRFGIVSDEEVGSPESRPLLQEELRGASAALVLEAGRAKDAIITARKGTGSMTARASGKAAHAGNAHDAGANAIWALARFVDRAQGVTDYARGVTVNVGKIFGGESKNTVPDRAEAVLDFRFTCTDDGHAAAASLREAAQAACAHLPGTQVELEGGIARTPLERTEGNLALFREYGACARESGLGDGEAPRLGGGSDASTTAAIGIPSIDGLGPRGSGFHTKEELIEVGTLVPKAEAIARFLLGRARP